jgi:hypothetical protein
MENRKAWCLSSLFAVCLAVAAMAGMRSSHPEPLTPPLPANWMPSAPATNAFQAVLRDAQRWRTLALESVKREMAVWEVEHPQEARDSDEALRRGLLMADHGGYLHRARTAARRAAELARQPVEAARAAELRVLIECESGHHQEEMRQALRVVALEGRSQRALEMLRRAAICNGDQKRAREIGAALATDEPSPASARSPER